MSDQSPNPIIEMMLQFRKALAKHDKQAIDRLEDAYVRIYARLKDKIDLLVDAIEMEAPTTGQLVRMARYKSLIAQVEEELTKFQVILANEVEAVGRDAIAFAGRDTSRLLRAIGQEYGIDVAFSRLPVNAIEVLLGFLAEDSPLFQRIGELAGTYAQDVANTILESVALGKGPREIARLIRDSLGGGLTDALRMTRTVQLWSYREANRATFIANGDIINGWYWFADLPGDPCMACIAEHGTFHELDETLDDHHNGRCAMMPAIRGLPSPIEQSGEDWFNSLSEADQSRLMGKDTYDAWKGGAFQLSDMKHRVENDVYGQMINQTPLWELLGAEPPNRTE